MKLLSIQEKHMAMKPVEEKKGLCKYFLELFFIEGKGKETVGAEIKSVIKLGEKGKETLTITYDIKLSFSDLEKVIHHAGDRIKVAGDILDFADLFMQDDAFPYDEAAVKKRIIDPPEAIPLLLAFRKELEKQEDFRHQALEQLMQNFLQSRNRKIADIIHALRLAVTGKSVGLGMFETLEILGKKRVLRRIDRTLAGTSPEH